MRFCFAIELSLPDYRAERSIAESVDDVRTSMEEDLDRIYMIDAIREIRKKAWLECRK